ncbi:hypothetical protein PUNSTDRAFT_125497 [Punctularia strigosozonata HHB-11173 SS5]|uniref:uncharacterized protein n=1 Tax=Punctularia strigosozonata (strain HHB-11173) TaxID=741275 RepID=UPI0004417EA4|nr:uncharacterized protein PUNSTDRAFT_125497 [Punctularia strigosozonata HHB-11173 SS5]EIN10825.1 hypothetical protein PUNSTDRAFT_125497 [Punctularia strigosozonata HHB-11173 SS5]
MSTIAQRAHSHIGVPQSRGYAAMSYRDDPFRDDAGRILHRPSISTINTVSSTSSSSSSQSSYPSSSPPHLSFLTMDPSTLPGSPHRRSCASPQFGPRTSRRRPLPFVPTSTFDVPPPTYASATSSPTSSPSRVRRLPSVPASPPTKRYSDVRVLPTVPATPERSHSPEPRMSPPIVDSDEELEIDWDMIDEILVRAA